MGCCPSTLYNSTQRRPYNRYPPPMPPLEGVKETIKEVLTETQPTAPPSKCTAFDHADLVKDQSSNQPKKLESYRDSKPPSSLPLPRSIDKGSLLAEGSSWREVWEEVMVVGEDGRPNRLGQADGFEPQPFEEIDP